MNLIERVKSGQILTPKEYELLFINHLDEIDDGFLNLYADKLDWTMVFKHFDFDDELLRRYMYKATTNLHRISISMYQKLSEDFMDEYKDELIWIFVSINQTMSEKFIREHQKYIDFSYLPYYQDISLSLIKDLMKTEKVSWKNISEYYPLKEAFILEYYEYLDKDLLKKNRALEMTESVELLFKLKE
jgi:hypothetical protein